MRFTNPTAETFVPDATQPGPALARTTHMGIGAHQDDLEIMAFHGIVACLDSDVRWFTGVTCTDGAGRNGGLSAARVREVRSAEQCHAAAIGRYGAVVQLKHPSAAVKRPPNTALEADLKALLRVAAPGVVYTHNPADRHDTHVGVAVSALEAIRALPADRRPRRVFGCEVWGSLDWLPAQARIDLDVSGREHLAAALVGLYDSQISCRKRYDLATLGRRRANATFRDSHGNAGTGALTVAMDLTPLAENPAVDIADHVAELMDRFAEETLKRLRGMVKSLPASPL